MAGRHRFRRIATLGEILGGAVGTDRVSPPRRGALLRSSTGRLVSRIAPPRRPSPWAVAMASGLAVLLNHRQHRDCP
jgi:hypothetical protein